MAIETQVQRRQTLQNVAYAVLCLVLALWGWYDYEIKIPAKQAAFDEYVAAEKTKSELENLAKAAGLSDAEKEQFRVANDVLNRYKDEKPAEPAAYDRPVQLWLYIVGCGVLGVPPFIYMQWRLWRSRRRLDDDGTLHGPEGSFTQGQIVGIDLSKWMDKGLAHLEVEGGTRIPLDQWKFKFTEDIVGVYAQRFEPGKWTSDAYPIGDPRSRETKKTEDGQEAAGGDAGASVAASANPPAGAGAKAAHHADGEAGEGGDGSGSGGGDGSSD
jgi:hypothetical protein